MFLNWYFNMAFHRGMVGFTATCKKSLGSDRLATCAALYNRRFFTLSNILSSLILHLPTRQVTEPAIYTAFAVEYEGLGP